MKKKFLLLVILLNIVFIPKVFADNVEVTYRTHIQNIGWQRLTKNGEQSGTTGKSLRLEAIDINLENSPISGNIEYRTHVQNIGWQGWMKNGEQSGTIGKSLRLEAIEIKLSGDVSNYYDIIYRTHVQNIGWQGWKKNGEQSGTTGKSLRLEAIEIKLVQKKELPNTDEVDSLNPYTELTYTSNVNNKWQDYVENGKTSGTIGQSLPIKGLKIRIKSNQGGSIVYQTYSNDKWNDYVNSDELTGDLTSQIEAIKIKLTDNLVNLYDIYYRVHVQELGWLDWVKNDTSTGTIGYYYRIEAIEIKLLEKNSNELKQGKKIFYESSNKLTYQGHVQNKGWMNEVEQGKTIGTTGQSLRLEAFKVKLDSKIGDIEYKSYVKNSGWQSYVKNGNISGTEGKCRNLEAIQIKLTGSLSNVYDIYYRVHVSNIGWLGWAKNDAKAGNVGDGNQIEAIEIYLIKKGQQAPGSTANSYVTGSWRNNNTNYYTYKGVKVSGWKFIDGKKYFFNSNGDLKGSNVKKVIDVSSYQKNINWNTIKNDGDVDRAIIRVGWGMSYDDEPGIDSYFDRNIKEVQRLGIPYQIYIYAYAVTEAAANKEANFVKNMMSKYNIPKSTHVWYDAEEAGVRNVTTYSKTIPTFVNNLKNAGYTNVGVYGNLYALTSSYLNNSTIKSYPIWVAQYYKNCQYTGNYIGWQYTSTDFINGIEGNVDVSMFKN